VRDGTHASPSSTSASSSPPARAKSSSSISSADMLSGIGEDFAVISGSWRRVGDGPGVAEGAVSEFGRD